MANPQLAKLQAQLRKEIQSHQHVVGRIKLEPYNADLRKQLNEQQLKIQALSDRQKWVVQDLRNELVQHEEAVKMGPLTSRSNNQQQAVHVPKLGGSFKLLSAPDGGTQRASHHTTSSSSHHGASHYANPSRMSIMTNSPIKVPTFTTFRITAGSNKHETSPIIQDPYKSVAANLQAAKKILKQQQQQTVDNASTRKVDTPETQKFEFMAALDLITPVMAEKLKRKRCERRRRTTANPQFSNYAKYEQEAATLQRQKSDNSIENGMPADKKRRGRPPKTPEDSRPVTPDNSSCRDVKHSPTQPWNGQLKVIQSYIQHRTTSEEEKKCLMRRSTELKKERILLEEKAKQLNDAITHQLKAKRDLSDSFKKTEETIEQLKSFLALINSTTSSGESDLPPPSPAATAGPPLAPAVGAQSS